MRVKTKKKKLCLAASSGGHYEQLMMLKPLLDEYDGFVLTERMAYAADAKGIRTYHIMQVNREEKSCIFRMTINAFMSLYIFFKERPTFVICTGVLSMIPMCLLVKLFGGKLIYIESFAKVTSPTKTGRLMYRFADRFYIQWSQMKEVYPDAIYLGGIY
ncbi:Hypothetical protein Tpal_2016 [Trichococcus palustris]|uniref:Polysaccharide biosynthesis protein n=1 Tax=Trichococcus palustris TaxID=140314 RepID=A0A143YSH1_9LACT|nr:PssD/Cps14F family polysaccharide biosynthesis glycosyltransferase [Trichococcus palustris]CZQ96500.1 Hypothetical protein Tpal_2016 [Trichococcus palustris]SFK73723.1 Oligosaccharide biosynthesis protein Alg14 like [Trichococcus palustris]